MPQSTAAAKYAAKAGSLEKLGSFESDVYTFEGPHGPSILKVIHKQHRSVEQVGAEIEWLLALKAAGVAVAEPLPAATGEWLVELEEPAVVLVAFKRAPGAVTKPPEWTDARLEAWGELLGRLQAHSRTYRPAGAPRSTLWQRTYLHRAADAVPEDERFQTAVQGLIVVAQQLLDHGPDAGLVHADLHSGNVLLNGERWTAIDFDDSGYGAYAFDLAMPLYYALRAQRDRAAPEAAAAFLTPFLRGFRRHAPEPAGGSEAVAYSLMLRDAELVVALRLKLPPEAWTEPLRAMELELRSRVAAGRWVLEPKALRRWFG